MLRAHDELGIEIGLTLAFLGFLLAAAVNDLLLARVPLVAIADDEGLARQGARTAVWFAGIGGAITTTLLLSASLTKPGVDHAAPYLIGGLIPVAILTSVALAFAIRGYRRAVRPSSPDENGEPSAWSPRSRGARPPSSGTQADHNPSDA